VNTLRRIIIFSIEGRKKAGIENAIPELLTLHSRHFQQASFAKFAPPKLSGSHS
jgi:hypothetical protein